MTPAKQVVDGEDPTAKATVERIYFLKHFVIGGAVCIPCRMKGMRRQFVSASAAFDHLVSYHKVELHPVAERWSLGQLAVNVYIEVPIQRESEP